jgi:hypothetical protein
MSFNQFVHYIGGPYINIEKIQHEQYIKLINEFKCDKNIEKEIIIKIIKDIIPSSQNYFRSLRYNMFGLDIRLYLDIRKKIKQSLKIYRNTFI